MDTTFGFCRPYDKDNPSMTPKRFDPLDLLQTLLVIALPMTVGTSPRLIAWMATARLDVFPEFQGIVYFLPDAIACALIALAVLRASVRGENLIGAKAGLALALIGWMLVSVIWSPSAPLAINAANKLVLALGVAWAASRAQGGRALLIGLVGIAILQSIIAIAQTLNMGIIGLGSLGEIYIDQGGSYYRGTGLTVNPNNLAGLLVLGGVAAVILWGRRWALLAASLAIIGAGLLATGSRGAWLGLAVAGMVGLILSPRALKGVQQLPRLRPYRLWIALGVGLGIVGVLSLNGAYNRVFARVFAERPFFLEDTLTVIGDRPWTGAGAGNLFIAMMEHLPVPSLTIPMFPAHNALLMIWGEIGLVGVCLVGGLFLQGAWRVRRMRLFLLGMVAIAVISMVDYYWWGDERLRVLLCWWVGVALALGDDDLHPTPTTPFAR